MVSSVKIQKIVLAFSVLLLFVKVLAWYFTHSVSILTDALESIVNVLAGAFGLYSLILSSKPKDKEHPYGHGKIEFISSAIEGVLISLAGIMILYKAFTHLFIPHQLHDLDLGLYLIASTGAINYILGVWSIKQGKKINSPILISSGAHLKSDTYSTLGLLLGIVLIIVTGLNWIDSVTAIIFAFVIIYTGYRIVRKSVSGIMDESDQLVINEIVDLLNEKRKVEWIDVHNMRVINYAGFYHIDCHLTVPFYINVNEAHAILDTLTDVVSDYFNQRVEFFVHIDGCVFQQCKICQIKDCKERKSDFEKRIEWNEVQLISNKKHNV
jgi:cation diffusion facilitator family transporter